MRRVHLNDPLREQYSRPVAMCGRVGGFRHVVTRRVEDVTCFSCLRVAQRGRACYNDPTTPEGAA